jgi:hypothetical protein
VRNTCIRYHDSQIYSEDDIPPPTAQTGKRPEQTDSHSRSLLSVCASTLLKVSLLLLSRFDVEGTETWLDLGEASTYMFICMRI